MEYVELSVTVPQARTPADDADAEVEVVANVDRWAATVAAATEPCLVIDKDVVIQAISPAAAELLGLGKPAEVFGKKLDGVVLRLIDFTAEPGVLEDPEVDKIAPLLAIRSGRLARGLIRVKGEAADTHTTVDAIATPLLDGEIVVGSLTFFSAVRY